MKKYMFLLFILLGIQLGVQAQFLKSLKERVKAAAEETVQRKAEEKVMEKTDQAAEKVMEAPFALLRGANKKDSGNVDDPMAMFEGMMGATQASYEPQYDFHTEVVTEFTNSAQKIEKQQMRQLYGEEAIMTSLPQTSNKTIVDFVNRSSLILNDENGKGTAISLDFMSGFMKEGSEKDQPMQIRRTGNTKDLLGYTCHEIIGEDDEIEFQGWYTEEIDLGMDRMLENLGNLFGRSDFMKGMGNDVKGMALEMITKTKKKGDMVQIQVLEINAAPVSVNTAEYTFPTNL